jgi:hypothetical protein
MTGKDWRPQFLKLFLVTLDICNRSCKKVNEEVGTLCFLFEEAFTLFFER